MANCTVCGKQTTKQCGKCSNAWYCRTECQRSDWKNHKKVCKYPFEIKESEGKGLGLFATRDLQIGDLVVCEDPIIYLSDGIKGVLKSPQTFKHTYENLGVEERNKILALVGADNDLTACNLVMESCLDSSSRKEDQEWKRALRIYGRNAIAVDDSGSALFSTISRINHSCSPNVDWSYLENHRTRKEVRVIRNIKVGEEVLVDYLAKSESFPLTSDRKEALRWGWHFECKCSLCSLDHDENDALRKRVQQLHDSVLNCGRREDVEGAANAALQKCKLLEKCEDLKIHLPKAYKHCRRTKLYIDKAMYNKKIKRLAMMGGSHILLR
ncbi:hypothetical protein ACHWQZ_G006014 [Mnemiopsis leidyi]